MKTLLWLTLLSCALVATAVYPSLGFAADDNRPQDGAEPADDSSPQDGAELADVAAPPPSGQTARYIVTYAKSNTEFTPLRTATVVTVTNQGTASCAVSVQFILGSGGWRVPRAAWCPWGRRWISARGSLYQAASRLAT
jgi:hypothetical protein